MKVINQIQVGSLESSDCLVTIYPSEENNPKIIIKSSVIKQFKNQIEKIANELVEKSGLEGFEMVIEDRGALEFALIARITTALKRAGGKL